MKFLPGLFQRHSQPEHDEGAVEKGWEFMDVFRWSPNWFQKASDLRFSFDLDSNTAVYTCVNILSQEVASLPIYHWRIDDKGTAKRVPRSNPERVLRRPNSYQTRSDFWLYMMRSLLLRGMAFAYAPRNKRNEVTELHPLPPKGCWPMVVPESGDVFYSVGNFGDRLVDVGGRVPGEFIFNPRINCYQHPLIGQSPITAFVNSAAVGSAIQRATARFFLNMGRPSGVLTTPQLLTKKVAEEIRDRWNSVTQGENIGSTPILHNDLKWQQISMTATDAEVIATYNLSVSDVAMAYRIPLFMLGDLSKASFRNVETLNRLFYTSSLRFLLEHLENHLDRLFELDGETEYLEFDFESGLLRGDLEQRINAITKGVQGGLFTPNEARKREQLEPKEGGDDLFLQKQMVPVSAIKELLDRGEDNRFIPSDEKSEEDAPEEEPASSDVDQALLARELFERAMQ